MRHIIVSTLVFTLAAVPASAVAGDAEGATASERILGALELPLTAQALRKAGADEKEVKGGLKVAKEKKLKAKETAELLSEAATAVKEHGPVDNFGAFVQSKLDAGLRGKALAAAIREEHAARGKGKGKGEGKGEGKGLGAGEGKGLDAGEGQPDAADGGDGKGPPDGKGPDGKGPPDGKGQPDDKGPPDAKGQADEAKGQGNAKAEDKGKGQPDDKGKPR